MRAAWRAALTCALLAALVAACQGDPAPSSSSPSPSATPAATCADLAVQIVDAIQAYVDGFADVDAAGLPAAVGARQGEFAAATADLRERGTVLGCGRDDLAESVRAELDRLTGGTSVQDALVATFRADPLGTYDPSDPQPVEVTVSTAADLVTVVALAGSGSTITLAPGTYALTTPLVALRPITLLGAGTEATTITSTAEGAAFVAAADGDVRLADLAIVHDGAAPASVVFVIAGGYSFDRVRVAGGVAGADGAGGFGILIRPAANPVVGGGRTQTLTDVSAADNGGGGVVVGGTAQPTIRGATVTGTAGCGLCWLEDGGGRVSDSTVTGVPVGLRIDDAASPSISAVTVDGTEAGFIATGTGAPEVRDCTFTGNATGIDIRGAGRPFVVRAQVSGSADVGVRVAGQAQPILEDVTVSGPAVAGIAVTEEAAPQVVRGVVTTTGEVGAIWAGRAAGSAAGLTIAGSRVGLQIGDDAAPRVTDVTVRDTGTASLLVDGRGAGSVQRLACASGPGGVVALLEEAAVTLTDSPTCEVVDER